MYYVSKEMKYAIYGIIALIMISLFVTSIFWITAYVKCCSPFEHTYYCHTAPSGPIDAVFTWVDSNDPDWKECRAKYEGKATNTSYERKRFGADNISQIEIECSVRCALKNASWIRTIWIATHRPQIPDFYKNLSFKEKRKVKIIHHDEFFGSNHGQLPVFNSHAIEVNLWKIPGLAENWLYLNDDFFITSPVTEGMFYSNNLPAIRMECVLNVKDCGIVGPIVCKVSSDAKIFLQSTSNISKYYGNNKFIPRQAHHACAMTKDMFRNSKIESFPCHRKRSFDEIPPIHFAILESLSCGKALMYVDKYECLHMEKFDGKILSRCHEYKELCVNAIGSYDDVLELKMHLGF